MIDNTRARITDKIRLENKLKKEKDVFKVECGYNYSTERETYPMRTRINNLYINLTDKSGYIENSLHKYFNNLIGNGNQNFNDFNLYEIKLALEKLESKIDYPLEQTVLTNLEFGFNIEINSCPTEFLKNNLLMHDFKTPCTNPKNDKSKKIKKFTYSEYEIKAYNKTLDQSRFKEFRNKLAGTNILRIEIKYKTKKQLNKLGIFNLSDLKKPQIYFTLLEDFFKKYKELLIIDSYNGNSLMSNKDRLLITHATHENYWIDLKKNRSQNTVTNHKKKIKKLIKKHGLDSWKKELKSAILKKFNELMTSTSKHNIKLLNAA